MMFVFFPMDPGVAFFLNRSVFPAFNTYCIEFKHITLTNKYKKLYERYILSDFKRI